MNAVRTSVATLAVLGVAGIASQASAHVVTINLNVGISGANYTTDLGTGTTVFGYTDNVFIDGPYNAPKDHGDFYSQNSGALGAFSSTPGFGAGDLYAGGTQEIAKSDEDRLTPPYLHLAFTDAASHPELGYASFDNSGTLTAITYTTSVPEPESWALLIAGAGLAGASLRRRRKLAIAA